MPKLTDTQRVILSSASRRNDRGVDLPANVTGEALRKAVDKLIRAGLLIACTWLGHAGRGAIAGETDAVRYGLLALGLLAAIALLPRLIGRWRRTTTS